MNKAILHTEIQEFIRSYTGNSSKLAFSGSPFSDVSVRELIEQLESRRKIEKKLPRWFTSEQIYYPPKLNLEQTSSEVTAIYKASLLSGNRIADITGGFGVDSFYFSEAFEQVDHFEINSELSAIASHNFESLGKKNIHCINNDGIKSISEEKYDVIYADPSRRSDSKGKVFLLEDCIPNIPDHLTNLFSVADTLLIKTSPMLDITSGLNSFDNVSEIHIVAVQNEVKELLWLLKKGFVGIPELFTINKTISETQEFRFKPGQPVSVEYGMPEQYLYEPNAAIMKSGAFSLVSEVFNVAKLHQHTHLYTSRSLKKFPGRRFLINEIIPYSKKDMRVGINFDKANIAVRNFPENVSALRRRWNIKDGGNRYIFFITAGTNKKMMLLCEKIK